MKSEPPVITAIECELGETIYPYHEAANFAETLAQHRIPNKPTSYGWGTFRRTERSVIELAVASAKKTLETARVDPLSVGMVVFCCIEIPGNKYDHDNYVRALLGELGTLNAVPIGLTFNNCLTLLSALTLASSAVATGTVRRALVISSDRVADEKERMRQYALFSDAAVSCLIDAQCTNGFQILNQSFKYDKTNHSSRQDIMQQALHSAVASELFGGTSVDVQSLKQVFAINLFRPITLMKETQGGIRQDQIFLNNVEKIGHCNAADPLINLRTYCQEIAPASGDTFMLCADAPSLRAAMLIVAR